MPNQTITRAIETDLEPAAVFAVLSDASLIPQWAPAFADKIEPVSGSDYRITKSGSTFSIQVLTSQASGTVDYLREMANGKRGGAYIRTMPRPLGGSTVTMTVPLAPNATSEEVVNTLQEELKALIQLAQGK